MRWWKVLLIPAMLFLQTEMLPAEDTEPMQLVPEGKFGQALDPREKPPMALQNNAYVLPPLTVEFWAKLNSKTHYNVMLANEAKSSGTHWEIYTHAGDGRFAVYMPGYTPQMIDGNKSITDGQWHYLAWVFDGIMVRLFVDGEQVVDSPVGLSESIKREPGPLNLGNAVGLNQPVGCDGLIDEVRISRCVRKINGVPTAPFTADEDTVSLWHMDKVDEKGVIPDEGSLGNHLRLEPILRVSMDQLDNESFKAGPSPMSSEAQDVALKSGKSDHPEGAAVLALDGVWKMAEGGDEANRLSGEWNDQIDAKVPGSVHTALFEAGKIPDPKFGRNDKIAHDKSFETYWFKTTFKRPEGAVKEKLVFDGVAIHCTVWLNGKRLGEHEGMFGGPEFDVAGDLKEENTLIVKINPAPGEKEQWNNPAWRTTVVFNNTWGWHYSSIPPLGIWRSVRIEGQPTVNLNHPFVATMDAQGGVVDLSVELLGQEANWSGKILGTILPDNFKGDTLQFTYPVKSDTTSKTIHLRFKVPNPQLWWPNGLGDPNLYKMKLSFVPEDGGIPDTRETIFGIRTVEMAPLPGGPKSTHFNWTFVLNKRPIFVKGAGWCTMDSSMDFSYERYDRLISLAQLQHVQMFRGWGSGMPETDEFYDCCNRRGIMVFQEWPTAWDSHLAQPYDILEETVRKNTYRLRNNPSLVMYGGGNESGNPFGKAIDMMGRYSIELDGTRQFHRGEPWGGSTHNYNCYWGWQPLDHNLNMTSIFFGEFGLACSPVYESVQRYLPDNEKDLWPAPADGSLAHHTPIFNTAEDLKRLMHYSAFFMPDDTMENYVIGSQLSQALGVRHPLELARTRWPECTGALYYKMNDNYPAASWACVDWYGAPKMSHFFYQDSFNPLHACVLFKTVNSVGMALSLPVVLLDDADELKGAKWEVVVRAYDEKLNEIKKESFTGSDSIERVKQLGEFTLSEEQTKTVPLLVVAQTLKDGKLAERTFYFVNYETRKGSLMSLPKTKVTMKSEGDKVLVTNEGKLPAVGVYVSRPGHADTFTADDGYFWLDAGETHAVNVNTTEGLKLEAWNGEE